MLAGAGAAAAGVAALAGAGAGGHAPHGGGGDGGQQAAAQGLAGGAGGGRGGAGGGLRVRLVEPVRGTDLEDELADLEVEGDLADPYTRDFAAVLEFGKKLESQYFLFSNLSF